MHSAGTTGCTPPARPEVACGAHARRKFVEARDRDTRLSLEALAYIRRLYDIELRAEEFDSDSRLSLRHRERVPVLRALGEWLTAKRGDALPALRRSRARGAAALAGCSS